MSEITFKTYGDLEVAESLSEASNMIIEENGEVKRYPASGIQSDWNASEGEPGYIKNRTHYEEVKEVIGDTLTWDGNTDGLITASGAPIAIYRISDAIVRPKDLANGAKVTFNEFGDVFEATYKDLESFTNGMNQVDGAVVRSAVYFVYEDNVEYLGALFPKAGVYTYDPKVDVYVESITIPDYTGFKSVQTVVKTIDPKYLPKIEKFYINGDKYLYRDVNCTTKASVDDIPDSCAIEIGRSVFFESAGTEKVIEWYNPVWVTSYYESFDRGYRTAAIIDEDGNCIKAYTAEHTPPAPT